MNFNHAMVYVKDMRRSLEFYAGTLGLEPIEVYPDASYARLKSPTGASTIALHKARDPRQVGSRGLRLYFETKNLDEVCRRLAKHGVKFTQPPADMPWGWRHAYLEDPDGHEVSLYWAGRKRLRPTR